ncbi:MAG: hypothetical protein M3Y42_04550 [Actinomycetota bacterium]|nr:hypothetical protein [Actinomycetota bacterium]MDQ2956218.1 hypothetical protein [Actinomycetota bacterium]
MSEHRSDLSHGDVALSRVPVRARRQLAAMLTPIGVVLLIAGVLSAILSDSITGRLVGPVVALIALLLLAISTGLFRSARLDERAGLERQLDEAILATAGAADCGGSGCGGAGACGVADCAVRALPRH